MAVKGGKKTKQPLNDRMIGAVLDRYERVLGDDGTIYALPRAGTGGMFEAVTPGFVLCVATDAGIPVVSTTMSAARSAAEILRETARGAPMVKVWIRTARYGDGVVVDLAQQGSARCVVVDGSGWRVEPAPPEGVLFRRSGRTLPLPDPVAGSTALPELLGLGRTDQKWHLIRGWQAASLLPDIPRPMLAFLGPPGSAKTTRANMVVSVVDPKPHEGLGGSFGKSQDDDEVTALAHYLLGLDNLGRISETVADHLCRLVTGHTSGKRRLYTDTETVSVTYRRSGVITAVSLPTQRPDALERLVPIRCERVPEADRRAESELWAEWDREHPTMLGSVLDDLSKVLAAGPSTGTGGLRMRDYHDAVGAVSPKAARAYREAVTDVMAEAAEADPFVVSVAAWIASEGGWFRGTVSEAWLASSDHRSAADSSPWERDEWWPKSADAFSKSLDRCSETLRAVGVTVQRRRSNGRRLLEVKGSEK